MYHCWGPSNVQTLRDDEVNWERPRGYEGHNFWGCTAGITENEHRMGRPASRGLGPELQPVIQWPHCVTAALPVLVVARIGGDDRSRVRR